VAGFLGRYEHQLDVKGRVIVPAKFRPDFERGGFLTQHLEGCLALWTPAEFQRQMEQIHRLAASGSAKARQHERLWSANSAEVEIDKQGRMPIPTHLRSWAHLESAVLVNGAIDRVELWQPVRWTDAVGPEESWLLSGNDSDADEEE
jgi:MraZ protein